MSISRVIISFIFFINLFYDSGSHSGSRNLTRQNSILFNRCRWFVSRNEETLICVLTPIFSIWTGLRRLARAFISIIIHTDAHCGFICLLPVMFLLRCFLFLSFSSMFLMLIRVTIFIIKIIIPVLFF